MWGESYMVGSVPSQTCWCWSVPAPWEAAGWLWFELFLLLCEEQTMRSPGKKHVHYPVGVGVE